MSEQSKFVLNDEVWLMHRGEKVHGIICGVSNVRKSVPLKMYGRNEREEYRIRRISEGGRIGNGLIRHMTGSMLFRSEEALTEHLTEAQ